MRTKLLLILLLHLYASNAWGQYFSEIVPVTWRVYDISSYCIGDMDNDGDDDMLVASDYPVLVWYENDLSGHFVKQHILNVEEYNLRYIAITDFDGDFDKDIVGVDVLSSAIITLTNNGLFEFTQSNTISQGVDAYLRLKLADLDGDGDLDLLANNTSEPSQFWIENLNNGSFGSPIILDDNTSWVTFTTTGDLDGDGDLDLLTSPSPTSIYWHENLGVGNFGSPQQISNGADEIKKMVIADVSGDSYQDIIAYNVDDSKITLLLNDGNGNFSGPQTIQVGDAIADFAVVDFENDGDMDLICYIGNENTIRRYTNDGEGNFSFTSSTANEVFFAPVQMIPVHLNTDGYIDFTLECRYFTQSTLNDSGSALLPPEFISPQIFGFTTPAHGDLNGDGDIEIVFSSYTANQIVYYDSLGVGSYENLNIIGDSLESPYDVFVLDMDADGDMDVGYVSYEENYIAWIENDGLGNFSAHHYLTSMIEYLNHVRLLDIDSDGDLDILTNVTNWFRNEGNGTWTSFSALWGLGSENADWADFDGDGDLDATLVINNDFIRIKINNGNGNYTDGPDYNINADNIATGYIDTDSFPDILVSSPDGGLMWLKNLGGNLFQYPAQDLNEDTSFAGDLSVIDLDGDGDGEILSESSPDGPAYCLINNGTLNFEMFVFDYQTGGEIQTTDLDNDEDLDIYFTWSTNGGLYYNTIGEGCTDPDACNYNPNASSDNGSCNYYQPGDFNCDGSIGGSDDIENFLSAFGCVGNCDPYDLDGDGFVGTNDLMMFFAFIGE